MTFDPRCWFRHDWQRFRPWKGQEIRWCNRCKAFDVRESDE